MSDTNNYSARHWAAKAKRYAEQAAGGQPVLFATTEEALAGFSEDTAMSPYTTKQVVSESIGRGIQLGFNGVLEGGVLTFTVPSENEGDYVIKDYYDYELDLLFEAVGVLDENIPMVIKNGDTTYNIVNVLHDDFNTPITVKDMKQIMKYTTDFGFRWIFSARCSTTQTGVKVFVMPSTVVSVEGVKTDSSNVFTEPQVFRGDNHPVVIEGMAGNTATGFQIKDTLASNEVDLEHYNDGVNYGLKVRIEREGTSKDVTKSYLNAIGKSFHSVLSDVFFVPTPDESDEPLSAVNKEYLLNSKQSKSNIAGMSDLSNQFVEYSTSLAAQTQIVVDTSGLMIMNGNANIDEGSYIGVTNLVTGEIDVRVATGSGQGMAASVLVSKGDTVMIDYSNSSVSSLKVIKKKGVL